MNTRGATKGAYVIMAIGAALYFAARTTGAGWLLVILCGLAGALLVGCVWPRLGLGRVQITASAPSDAMVDQTVPVTLRVTRAGLGIRIAPTSPPGETTAVIGDSETVTDVTLDRRGVISAIEVQAASAAPFGLVWWRRRMRVTLERAIEVAPRVGSSTLSPPPSGAFGESQTAGAGIGGDHVRGVRDYVSGDPLRLVHWPATARRGAIVVKEFEQPKRPRLEVVVDLRGPAAAAERAAEHAMGVLCDALTHGVEVTLCTAEAGGPRRAVVTSQVDAGRRLARATAGALPAGQRPDGPVVVISGSAQVT